MNDELCAERFARDRERLERLEGLTDTVSQCSIKLSEIARQNDEKLRQHEKRLEGLEDRPGNLWDKVAAGVIAAAAAFLMGVVLE